LLLCGLTALGARAVERVEGNPDPRKAAGALLRRLMPGQADGFAFETVPSDAGRDVFEIETMDARVVIRGNSGVSMAMGLNWYLKHYARAHFSLDGSQLTLPDAPPTVQPKIRQVSWARHRYFLNYCCFGYSLPWYDWEQWERLIDWMALNGVNLPLAVTGQEVVWRAVCRRLGLTDEETAGFFAGPPYLPFQWMGCLDGHGGPLPDDWMTRHEALQRRILARERELGMTPVLQGFTGHVPVAVARRFPGASLQRVRWIEWETCLLDPLDPLFARIAGMFLEEQTRRFGGDHFYAADTFIEMVPPSGDAKYLADLGRAIYRGMTASDPRAVWVLQGWAFMNQRQFWTQPRLRAFLDAIPNDRMLVLDLFCETTPMWDQTDAFCGKPWLWCNVQNFGNTVGLGAALTRNNAGLYAARRDPNGGQLVGLGFVNEGLDYNPVAYDLMFENAWRKEPVDLSRWISGYATHRYGHPDADAQRAWRRLLISVLNRPPRDASSVTSSPTLSPRAAMTPEQLIPLAQAWRDLLRAADRLGGVDTFQFDLANVARQVLANHADQIHADVVSAWRAKDMAQFEETTARYLRLLRDLDELLATRSEFLLGVWLEDAQRWGATPAERSRYEWNARRVLTLWGETSALNDYARKQWSGLIEGYYAPRWRRLFETAADSLRLGRSFDDKGFASELFRWTVQWSDRQDAYPATPRGDTVAVARRLWRDYGAALLPDPTNWDRARETTPEPTP